MQTYTILTVIAISYLSMGYFEVRNISKNIIKLTVLLLISCGSEKRLHLVLENCNSLDSCIIRNEYTIICYIDSAACTVCALQWLNLWTLRKEELKKMNTGIVLIVNNPEEEVVYNTLESLQLEFPVTFDKLSTIKQKNDILINKSVFMINKEKEVIWLGLPIQNEKTWDLFCKTIQYHSKSK